MYTAVAPLSKYLQHKSVRIYDLVFTLHSKCTVALLLACTCLLSAKQYFGDPIQCISDLKFSDYVHSYCWTMGTYIWSYDYKKLSPSDREYLLNKAKGAYENATKNSATPGTNLLYIQYEQIPRGAKTERIFLRYYQWVVLVLLLQSFVFYFPAFLWKVWEGGRLKYLCAELHHKLDKEKITSRLGALVEYFRSDYKDAHFRYFASYVLCEVMNFTISIVNMLLLNVFLDNFWAHYIEALNVVPSYNWDLWNHIVSRIFPKIAKCQLQIYGAGGSNSVYDNLCLLPLNIVNEKIFAFLWIWFILMALLAGLKLFYRLLVISHRGIRFHLLHTQARFMSKSHVQSVIQNCSYGDWFVLMRVANNISPETFRQLLQMLYSAKCPRSNP
ncbi:innexin inx4 [Scaptodrosophila lebanonensis]|uniref:Innexin n=1 Tax=Drosophila lebanonensis TaxID=7225 RepID=A0A6J2TAZ8_DROLE|nr:innexin inx4 [Scaptodrosophila lebanonensis]